MPFTRSAAIDLDAFDQLALFRRRYVPTEPGVVAYLDGNSLGRPLAVIPEVWQDLAHRQWAGRLIRSWSEGWLDLPEQVGNELAAAALGAAPGQTVIADSTTVNFYKAMRAAVNLRPGRRRMVIDRDNFPTDRYIVESLARDLDLEIVWITGSVCGGVTVDDLLPVLDDTVAVLTLSHIAYHSGYLADAEAITALAHSVGAVVVWDLSHSVGSTPVELDDWGVDFAVGCTYKFVGAGPGAPAFCYVNAAHHERLDQPIWGWLGRRDAFEMEQDYLPASGIRAMISGTPSIPGILAVRGGAKVIAEAGIGAIRAKAVQLTGFALEGFDEWLVPAGFGLASPRESGLRGAHLSITRADARELCAKLIAVGVIPDFRTPDALRIGLSPLTTSFTEVWDAFATIADLAA